MICSACGWSASPEDRFCVMCGAVLSGAKNPQVVRNEVRTRSDISQPSPTYFDSPDDPRLLQALVVYDRDDLKAAIPLLEPLAREGNVTAIFKLGNCYSSVGDADQGMALWRIAAEQGHPGAQNNLGLQVLGDGQTMEAETLFRNSAARGNIQAFYNLSAVLKDRGDYAGYEIILRDLGRQGFMPALSRLGIQGLEMETSATDARVLRTLHHLSLGTRQGSAACANGMALAALRLGEWSFMGPWLVEAVSTARADSGEDWVPGACISLRFAYLLAERRWSELLDWLADSSNVTSEVDDWVRRELGDAIRDIGQDPRRPEEMREQFLTAASRGLGRFGVTPLNRHTPQPWPVAAQLPAFDAGQAAAVRQLLTADPTAAEVVTRGDVGTMAAAAREALQSGNLSVADYWYLEWVTADVSIQEQINGLSEYASCLLIPQGRFEEAALYLTVVDHVVGVNAPPGLIAAMLSCETARYFSDIGQIKYSREWMSVDRGIALSSDLSIETQYLLVLAALMRGDEKDDGAKGESTNAELKRHYLSAVAGLLIGLEEGVQPSGVSRELLARVMNDWLAFRPACGDASARSYLGMSDG